MIKDNRYGKVEYTQNDSFESFSTFERQTCKYHMPRDICPYIRASGVPAWACALVPVRRLADRLIQAP